MLNQRLLSMKHLLVPLVGALLIAGPGVAQQTESPTRPASPSVAPQTGDTPKSPPSEKRVSQPPRGRLPAYFAALVSQTQRGKIYAVQAQYNQKVSTLRMQITQLLAERDRDVDGVLSPEQLSKVNEKRKVAAVRRKSRRSGPFNSANP